MNLCQSHLHLTFYLYLQGPTTLNPILFSFENLNTLNTLNFFIKLKYNKMPCQLPADCLNNIFEHLENKMDLRSFLLVNRLWCEVSVPILWTSIQNYNTLIACLPIESKEILFKNEIIISTPTSKSPLFNYATFIKNLSLCKMCRNIKNIF